MSEHNEFLPPSPVPLTEENVEQQLSLDTNNLPTPPPAPSVSRNLETVDVNVTFEEQNGEVFEESQRLLNEVHESDQLVIDSDFSIKEHTDSENNDVMNDLTTLANLVTLLLGQDDRMKKYNLPVSDETKLVLSKLLSVDNYFDGVEKLMKDIVHDGKIDARDVPKIMLLLTELYKMSKQIKDVKFDEKVCGDVLKVLFNIALKEKLIPIAEEDLELLKCLYEIVDTSITLLQTDTSGVKKGIVYQLKKLLNSCKK